MGLFSIIFYSKMLFLRLHLIRIFLKSVGFFILKEII